MKLDIGIVTCCTPNYAKYLAEWAASIIALKTKPTLCAIVVNGQDRKAAEMVQAAVKMIGDSGVLATWKVIPAANIGVSRNAAVAMADTEWVMHFDVDDRLMPHALCDIAALASKADVVALGYERFGDLKAGPANRTRVYRNSQGQATLDSVAPSSGVSPFRRKFWERSPYRTDMEGGWDTALWLGFAHLNARFVATKRPCFYYRQHADSVFNARRKDAQKTARVGMKLRSLRRGDNGVSLIVPRSQGDHSSRAASWEWLQARYRAQMPELQIVIGKHMGQPWCKGVVVNAAVEQSSGEVLVIADSDCWVDPATLREAVELVRTNRAPWVVPHTNVHRLDQASTEKRLLAPPTTELRLAGVTYDRKPYIGYAGGGIVVVGRAALDYAGGFPTGFVGWGCEDEAFALCLDSLLGHHTRLGADLWHFWHPIGQRLKDAYYQRNRKLFQQYKSAARNAESLWHFIQNGGQVRALVRQRQRQR